LKLIQIKHENGKEKGENKLKQRRNLEGEKSVLNTVNYKEKINNNNGWTVHVCPSGFISYKIILSILVVICDMVKGPFLTAFLTK